MARASARHWQTQAHCQAASLSATASGSALQLASEGVPLKWPTGRYHRDCYWHPCPTATRTNLPVTHHTVPQWLVSHCRRQAQPHPCRSELLDRKPAQPAVAAAAQFRWLAVIRVCLCAPRKPRSTVVVPPRRKRPWRADSDRDYHRGLLSCAPSRPVVIGLLSSAHDASLQ